MTYFQRLRPPEKKKKALAAAAKIHFPSLA